MTATTSSDRYLLLSLPEHQGAVPDPRPSAGSFRLDVRCLNAAGRWAVQGRPRAPWLAWLPAQSDAAHAAAERASRARHCPVEVVARGDARWLEGQDVRLFTEAFEPALHGSAALSAGRSRRLATEMEKLVAFSLVVRAAAAAASQPAYAEVSRAASEALRAKFGDGSVASACAWLAGRAGRDALDSLLAGEVEATGRLSLRDIAEAVELARDIGAVQRTGPGD